MIRKYLQKRRATQALSSAMTRGSLADMQQAIDMGADLGKVSKSFDEPAQHFQMSYDTKGALPLAIELNLPLEAFRLLLDAGAAVPSDNRGQPDPQSLFFKSQLSGTFAQDVLSLINSTLQRREISTETPGVAPSSTGRRRGL